MTTLLLLIITFLPFQTLNIRGHKWHVKQVLSIAGCSDCAGLTDSRTRTIYVDVNATPAQMQDTILHEALHAEYCELGIDGAAQNDRYETYHEFIYDAPGLFIDLMQNNPALRDFINAKSIQP